MSGLAAVLDAIGAVTSECTLCGQPLGDSPSEDFCSERCQWRWKQARSLDPGGVYRAALAAEIGRRHPDLEAGDWARWGMHVLSFPRDCPHCGALLFLGENFQGGWGWVEVAQAYERSPGDLVLRCSWHMPLGCAEAVFHREQGSLFELGEVGAR